MTICVFACLLAFTLTSLQVMAQSLTELGSIELDCRSTGSIGVTGDVACLTVTMETEGGWSFQDSVAIVDISDPANPVLAGLYATYDGGNEITCDEVAAGNGIMFILYFDSWDNWYIEEGEEHMSAVDITDPYNPTLLDFDTIEFWTTFTDMTANDDWFAGVHHSYAWDWWDEDDAWLDVTDINPFNELQIEDDWDPWNDIDPDETPNIDLDGDLVYLNMLPNHIQIIELGSGTVGTIDESVTSMSVYENRLYLISSSWLRTFDVSNPAEPLNLGEDDVGWPGILESFENSAVLGTSVGLFVFDTGEPTNLVRSDFYPGYVKALLVNGDYLYVAFHDRMTIYECHVGDYIAAFEIIEPANKKKVIGQLTTPLTFRWESTIANTGDTVEYALQLASDSGFNNIVAEYVTTADSMELTELPDVHPEMSWRIQARSGEIVKNSMQTHVIHYPDIRVPFQFDLVSPAPQSIIADSMVTLNWEETRSPYLPHNQELDDYGGPDNQGYIWLDSNDPAGPVRQWIDIADTGTRLDISNLSFGFEVVDLPWSFTFYGQNYSQVTITTEGYVSFDQTGLVENLPDFPNPEPPNAIISPAHFYAMNPSNHGDIYYWHEDSILIMQWDDINLWAGGQRVTFQLVLNQFGGIFFIYEAISINSNVGIESPDGLTGIDLDYNYVRDIESGHCILFQPGQILYRVAIAPQPSFQNPLVFFTPENDIDVGPFPDGQTIFWRVQAIDRFKLWRSADPWEGWSFTVDLIENPGASEIDPYSESELQADEFVSISPNPANAEFLLTVRLQEQGSVSIRLYDLLGREVLHQNSNQVPEGTHVITIDAKGLPSGVYFLNMSVADRMNETRKLILLK